MGQQSSSSKGERMNILAKIGFALLALGGLIFAGAIIWGLIQLFVQASIPWYLQLAITVVILGIILMFLSAVYDRYKNSKTEEVHEKV
jgi:membrane protein implicated in regulation of membrane protease activity